MAVGTEAGDVLICDISDMRATIHSICSGAAVTAVAPFGKASCLWSFFLKLHSAELQMKAIFSACRDM